jgi:hypothetical protein
VSTTLTALQCVFSAGLTASFQQPIPTSVSGATLPAARLTYNDGLSLTLNFGNGATGGTANQAYSQVRQLAAGACETIVLSGNLVNTYNVTFGGFATILGIIARPLANPDGSNASTGLQISGGAFAWPGWFGNGAPTVSKGGVPYIAGNLTGVAVSNAANSLKITNTDSGNVLTYSLSIVGR